jgi:hypothetical protein
VLLMWYLLTWKILNWTELPLLTLRLHELIRVLTNLIRIPFGPSGERKSIISCLTKYCWHGEKKLRPVILEFFYQFHNSFQFCGLYIFLKITKYHPGSSGLLHSIEIYTITDPSKIINPYRTNVENSVSS